MEKNREVEQAVAALTAEILKLSALGIAERNAVSVTIENALSRLTEAILAQAKNAQCEYEVALAPVA